MEEKIKRIFRVSIKIKGCDKVFKEGLDPGVIGYQDFEFFLTKKQYASNMFAANLLDYRNAVLNDLEIGRAHV